MSQYKAEEEREKRLEWARRYNKDRREKRLEWARKYNEDRRSEDLSIIATWKNMRRPGDPPRYVERAISREQVRLVEGS